MFIAEDPLLALILRFVVDTSKGGGSNEEFLDLQLQTLKKHLAHFPDEEQGIRALEWIEQRAQRYRQDWERRTVSHRTLCLRCADCPLADRGVEEHCEIHEQWLYLLRRYTTGRGVAAEFVEGALRLLQANKEQLKVRTLAQDGAGRPPRPVAPSVKPVEPPVPEKPKAAERPGQGKPGKAKDKPKRKGKAGKPLNNDREPSALERESPRAKKARDPLP